jgi:hypothetical protein
MNVVRLGALFLLAALAAAQDSPLSKSVDSNISEPKLPVIETDACPGTRPRAVVVRWRVEKGAQVYSSWQDKSKLVVTLKAGDEVAVLAGVNVIREPDRARVKQAMGHPSLKPGEVIPRYGLRYNPTYGWSWNFWAKGVWFTDYIDPVVEKNASCNFDDYRGCDFKVIQNGVKEWWVKVKTGRGLTGWVLAAKVTHDKNWNGAFDGLCANDDEGD